MDLYSNINFRLRTEEPSQIVISLCSTKIMFWLETYVENWATLKILGIDTPPQTVFDTRFKAKPRAALWAFENGFHDNFVRIKSIESK